MIKIAINGMGRIGKNLVRILTTRPDVKGRISLVALNCGPAPLDTVIHGLKYDSILGAFPGTIKRVDNTVYINDNPLVLYNEINPEQIPWNKHAIDWVIEASGKFRTQAEASQHITAGARRVVISAPSVDAPLTVVPGYNLKAYTNQDVISLGSCTTNALMLLLKVIDQVCTVEQAFFTTIHAYTNDQVLLDVDHKDMRRARAAAVNIIPTTTGASHVVGILMPHLKGVVGGCSVRVPVANVSLLDVVCKVKKPLVASAINDAYHQAAQKELLGLLALEQEQLVSSDFMKNSHSVTIDASLTQTIGNLIKVYGWYDNEWGYSNRLVDFLLHTIA